MANDNRLGELLVREKLVSLAELRKARELAKASGANLSKSLTKLGYVSDTEVTEFIANQYNVPAIDLSEYTLDPEIVELIPQDVAERHKILPISRAGTALVVAMVDPTNLEAVDDIKFLTGLDVCLLAASSATSSFLIALAKLQKDS